ncbi:DMT family transporter [Methylobacterium radiotolerans]|jgi:transporter family-2 protein|uniref:DMT family transporter n=1 Tax=Methylobacterium radiotolerans TaxID=31998 RepID=UPI0015F384A6|nr:DMT family transporter [Methylobacterium radiotolerans]MBE7245220.1 DMT family transporter [Actinomycetospora chiangmaiensis]UIY41597.1 DMT family transporter [Methylobacterium radiotolerans]
MLFLYGFALLAGVATAIEPGQNAGLAKSLARPLLAGVVSLVVSVAAISVAMLVTGQYGLPPVDRLAQVPWWAWLGGLMSAGLTMAQLSVSKRIGAATFLGLIVTAGVVTSILLDHFGLVGFKVHEAGLSRVLGGALMIGGVGLVARF